MPQITYTTSAQTHATAHWNTTTPAAHFPPSSRLIDATAATQGLYSRQNTSSAAAAGTDSAASTPSVPANRMFSVDTTLYFAINPVIKAVETRQSPKPSGAKIGAITPEIIARMLFCESLTICSCGLKVCRNQMMMRAGGNPLPCPTAGGRHFSHSACGSSAVP